MTEPTREEIPDVLAFIAKEADRYLDGLDAAPVREPNADAVAHAFGGPIPEQGAGALATLAELVSDGLLGAVRSPGPRFYHWVIGGTTPAALGADWLASAIDQNVGGWDASPLGAHLESVSIAWLKELFGLPADWGGVLTTGATMANFVCLAVARRWWGERHGIDVDERGMAGQPPVPVFGSGYVHPSDVKALGMLGIGRASVRMFARDDVGRIDLPAMEQALRELDGAPAIVICSAGEVNAGDFDPVAEMADLAERYDAWLHVDGAFGLFAAASPRVASLVAGVERADSVIADGHKWLNVPHESGFAFVKDGSRLADVFGAVGAAYLPGVGEVRPNWGWLGPEMSRRGRSLPVWATLRAYGRSGYRAIVERGLDLAQHVAAQVDEAPDLERLADVPLNVVCFRYHPPGVSEEALDELNARIGREILHDGRVYVGTTRYAGRVAFRPTFVNWRTTPADTDLMLQAIRELGSAALADGGADA
jgi:glutamate/tyrosine decarboxylase-like PLP-dependent enzyme